jgi:hypothetical protein
MTLGDLFNIDPINDDRCNIQKTLATYKIEEMIKVKK